MYGAAESELVSPIRAIPDRISYLIDLLGRENKGLARKNVGSAFQRRSGTEAVRAGRTVEGNIEAGRDFFVAHDQSEKPKNTELAGGVHPLPNFRRVRRTAKRTSETISSAKDCPHIFERFYGIDKSRSRSDGGCSNCRQSSRTIIVNSRRNPPNFSEKRKCIFLLGGPIPALPSRRSHGVFLGPRRAGARVCARPEWPRSYL